MALVWARIRSPILDRPFLFFSPLDTCRLQSWRRSEESHGGHQEANRERRERILLPAPGHPILPRPPSMQHAFPWCSCMLGVVDRMRPKPSGSAHPPLRSRFGRPEPRANGVPGERPAQALREGRTPSRPPRAESPTSCREPATDCGVTQARGCDWCSSPALEGKRLAITMGCVR